MSIIIEISEPDKFTIDIGIVALFPTVGMRLNFNALSTDARNPIAVNTVNSAKIMI